MLQEVSQTFIRLRPRFTAVVTRPDRRLCPTTPALLRPSGTRFPRKRNSPAQRQMAQNRLLRLAEPGGMSYASVLSSTARAWSPRVFGEHGRSRAFCGEYPVGNPELRDELTSGIPSQIFIRKSRFLPSILSCQGWPALDIRCPDRSWRRAGGAQKAEEVDGGWSAARTSYNDAARRVPETVSAETETQPKSPPIAGSSAVSGKSAGSRDCLVDLVGFELPPTRLWGT